MRVPAKTRVAQRIFWLSGVTSKVKTPQHLWEIVSVEPWETRKLPRRWTSCRFSGWLLRRSLRLDPYHWDHWALQHTDCQPHPCAVCGGMVCGIEWEDDA